jgi:DNA helicase II / ATP-dependent DNA helicase PcrA
MFTPSKNQQSVFDFITDGTGNAVVQAVAGSGKTTTILNALKKIPADKQVLFCAFSREIAKELKERTEGIANVTVKTLHGYGYSALMKYESGIKIDNYKYSKMLRNILQYLQTGKSQSILEYGFKKEQIANFPFLNVTEEETTDTKNYYQRVLDLCSLARLNIVNTVEQIEDIAYKYKIELINGEAKRAMQLMRLGEYYTATVDYTDMVYLPIKLNLKTWQYDWVFVDECQDLNTAQRNLFQKAIKPNGRFVAVGDPKQCIFGFAGADISSFEKLKRLPNTIQLPLSVCYRCGKKIIELAQEIVPYINWHDDSKDGIIDNEADIADLRDGDMVICRNTYPLVKLCFDLLRKGVLAKIKGRDIGQNLINMVEGTKKTAVKDVFSKLYAERDKIKNKIILKEGLKPEEAETHETVVNYQEKIEIIEMLADGVLDAREIVEKLDRIFSDEEKTGVQLSTIHKSKGLEADRVFIIHQDLMPSKYAKQDWEKEQEQNLIYVAYTRAKSYLGFVPLEIFNAFADKEKHSRAGQVEAVKDPEFVGSIGEKYPCELEVTKAIEMNTAWGDTILWKLKDKYGNIFSKFGDIPPRFLISNHSEVKEGSVIRVNATIKEHKTYNGEKQNVISHIAIYTAAKRTKFKKFNR